MKETQHEYDNRIIWCNDTCFFWGRTAVATDVLDEDEHILFTLPWVATERDVRVALYGFLEGKNKKIVEGL